MPFTREDMSTYEAKTPTNVDDKTFDPWNPSTPVETKNSTETPPVETKEPEVKTETSPPVDTAPASDKTATSDGSPAETAESAPATAEPEGETQPTVETKDEGSPRKGSAQERIEELVAERNALRKYGEYILEQARQARSQTQAQEPKAQEVPANDPIPTLEAHNYDPVSHAQALNEWVDRQVNKRVTTAVQDFEAKRDETSILATFANRVEEFKKTHPDFDLVLSNPALPSIDKLAARQIVRLEKGVDVAYHLATNPDLAARVSRMAPEQQLIAIGRIEAQLMAPTPQPTKTAPAEPKRTVSKAPPPPTPVKAAASNTDKPEDLMSMEEWVAKDRARKIAEKEEKRRMRQAMRG